MLGSDLRYKKWRFCCNFCLSACLQYFSNWCVGVGPLKLLGILVDILLPRFFVSSSVVNSTEVTGSVSSLLNITVVT